MKHTYLLFLLVLAVLVLAFSASAQPWAYDFGLATGSHYVGESTTFLPAPEPNGGSARVRIGGGDGYFSMENQDVNFGVDSYLRGVASSGASPNKFAIYDYAPAKAFTLKFLVRFGSPTGTATASAGEWLLLIGDGPTYGNNDYWNGNEVFAGIRWQYCAAHGLHTQYRNGTLWSTAGIAGEPLAQGIAAVVELYGNNTTASLPYNYGGSREIAPNTFDLWVNGVLVGDDLPKAALGDNLTIDSWMFYGISSTENEANIFVDNLLYLNDIADTPLPVQLASFSALRTANGVRLTWLTASELDNYGFFVERRNESEQIFRQLSNGFIAGHGTTIAPQEYAYTDENSGPGVWYYRLRQMDRDGSVHYSDVVKVDLLTDVRETTPATFALAQNYPNPFNPSTSISFTLPGAAQVTVRVYDVTGQEVATLVEGVRGSGSHEVLWNGTDARGRALSSGTYLYRFDAQPLDGSRSIMDVKRMMLVK